MDNVPKLLKGSDSTTLHEDVFSKPCWVYKKAGKPALFVYAPTREEAYRVYSNNGVFIPVMDHIKPARPPETTGSEDKRKAPGA
jgi:hypothetical protein